MEVAIIAKNSLNMIKRVIYFYWKKPTTSISTRTTKNHFDGGQKNYNFPDWLKAYDVLLWHQSKNALKKNTKLKKTIWFYLLQENRICWSHIIFYFLILKGVFHISYSLCLWLFPNVDLCLKGGFQNL